GPSSATGTSPHPVAVEQAVGRSLAIAALLAALFWFYPTNYQAPGWRGDFELSFARFTRIGLRTPLPDHPPRSWRTANSRQLAGTPGRRQVLDGDARN